MLGNMLLAEGGETITITAATLMGDVATIFGSAIDMVESVASEITGEPLLLLFVLIPLVGIGIGLFKRLMNVN